MTGRLFTAQAQLEIALFPGDEAEEIRAEGLFAPNGRRRCEHCRKRLVAFGGRLLCSNAHCPVTS